MNLEIQFKYHQHCFIYLTKPLFLTPVLLTVLAGLVAWWRWAVVRAASFCLHVPLSGDFWSVYETVQICCLFLGCVCCCVWRHPCDLWACIQNVLSPWLVFLSVFLKTRCFLVSMLTDFYHFFPFYGLCPLYPEKYLCNSKSKFSYKSIFYLTDVIIFFEVCPCSPFLVLSELRLSGLSSIFWHKLLFKLTGSIWFISASHWIALLDFILMF